MPPLGAYDRRYSVHAAVPVRRARKRPVVPAVAAMVAKPTSVQPVPAVIVMTPEPEPSTFVTLKSKDESTLALLNVVSISVPVGSV